MEHIAAAIRIRCLTFQLSINILDGQLVLFGVGTGVQQVEQRQGHRHRIQLAGMIVCGRTVAANIGRQNGIDIAGHLIAADHHESIKHDAIKITPAVPLTFCVPGEFAGSIVGLFVGVPHLRSVALDDCHVCFRRVHARILGGHGCQGQHAHRQAQDKQNRQQSQSQTLVCSHVFILLSSLKLGIYIEVSALLFDTHSIRSWTKANALFRISFRE